VGVSTERAEQFLRDLESEVAGPKCDAAFPVEGPMQTIRDLSDKVVANFDKIDATEAEEILGQLTEAAMSFAAGNWVGGVVKLMGAMSAYRKALQS